MLAYIQQRVVRSGFSITLGSSRKLINSFHILTHFHEQSVNTDHIYSIRNCGYQLVYPSKLLLLILKDNLGAWTLERELGPRLPPGMLYLG